ncbi:hypothetical protein ACQW02_07950 [Humitalea sp. 24SJ18S-53]|uniref:hypothetical protein n=1 Tax=Humitalea sp. 24SJ18S-53 TaxID=3422307 RepID=UPI003D67295B
MIAQPTHPRPVIGVFSGPIGASRTARLLELAARDRRIGGVVSPQEGATRWFRDLRDLAAVPMDASAEAPEEAVQIVGRFRFRASAFRWAAVRMENALGDERLGTIVLDEIGPLELRGLGFAPWLPGWIDGYAPRLLLVVRDSVVQDVADRFGFVPDYRQG